MQRLQFTCDTSLCVPACWMQCSCPGTAVLGTVAVGTTWDPSKPKIWLEQVGSEEGLSPAHRIVHALQHTRSITALI